MCGLGLGPGPTPVQRVLILISSGPSCYNRIRPNCQTYRFSLYIYYGIFYLFLSSPYRWQCF